MLTPRAHTQRTHNSTPRVAAAPTPSLLLRPRLVPTRSWRFPRCRSRKGAGLPPAPPLRGPRSTTSPRSRPGKLVEFDVRARCAVPASHPLRRALSTDPPMVVRPGSTQLSGFEVRFLVSGPAALGYAPAAAGCRPRAEHPRRQPAATVADADAAAPRRRRQLPRRRRRRRRRRPRRHRHRRHPPHRRHRRRRRSHYPRRRHRRRRSSRRRSRAAVAAVATAPVAAADADAPPRAPYPVPVPPVPMSPLPLPLPPAMTPPPPQPKKPTMPSARRRRCCRSSAHAEGHGRRRGDADAGVGWVKCRAGAGGGSLRPGPKLRAVVRGVLYAQNHCEL